MSFYGFLKSKESPAYFLIRTLGIFNVFDNIVNYLRTKVSESICLRITELSSFKKRGNSFGNL